jgi:carbon-monoxide dehydrogenase large subunit
MTRHGGGATPAEGITRDHAHDDGLEPEILGGRGTRDTPYGGHVARIGLAQSLGLPENKVRVIAPDVGGGFGGKLQTTPEEFATLAVARRLGKPCKYTETRSESLISAHHGRDQWQKLTLAATKEGKVTGLKVDLLADLGAYVGVVGGGVPVLGAWMFNAIYKFDAYQFNCTPVLTNKTWVDAYRGAGRPEATYGIERMMDELAAELGKDPLEVREMNQSLKELNAKLPRQR